MKALTILLIIGFPLILLFAWIYEMTPEGLRQTTTADQENSTTQATNKILNRIIIGVLLVAVSVLIIDRSRIALRIGSNNPLSESTISPENREKRITILNFVNQTNSEDLESYGNMLSDWITRGLMETNDANVVNSSNLKHLFTEPEKGRERVFGQEFYDKSGISMILQGRYYLAEDRLIVTADITDVLNGEVIRTFQKEGDRMSSMELLDKITEEIMSYWLVKDHVQFSQYPPHYEAYDAYLKGLSLFAVDANEALEYMKNAFEIDSFFFSSTFPGMGPKHEPRSI